MKFLRDMHDKAHEQLFKKGKPLEKLYPIYEAQDTILFTPGKVTNVAAHVRDGLDQKRLMITVVTALGLCMFMAMYNTGYQAFRAIEAGAIPLDSWQTSLYLTMGWEFNTTSLVGCILYGAFFYIPIYAVTMIAGGLIEVLFAVVRRHEISEGFLVTGALFPLILAPTTPLWQVAMGIIFGVFVGKEIFGGVGMNFLNPALTARAFLFFAYPAQISGDKVWIAAQTTSDGYSSATKVWRISEGLPEVDASSGATLLGRAAQGFYDPDTGVASGLAALQESGFTWWDAFIGRIPGSMGETSTLFCLVGAAILIATRIGSWRTMAGAVVGSLVMVLTLNVVGSDSNPFFDVPFHWHWVLGGFAFAVVYMATDPVTASFTDTGKLIYGFFIGLLGILIRVINPAYPEGWMLAILFMNMFAPLIDHFIVQANIKRRAARYAA